MASPLMKRLPRELCNNAGKYLGIFLLMSVCVALTSGFLLAAHSITVITDGMRDTYNIEDGRLTTTFQATDEQLAAARDAAGDVSGVTLYDNFAVTAPFVQKAGDDGKARNVRATVHQEEFNVAAYAQGRVPTSVGEIALDRCFAANNGIGLGDEVELGGVVFTVVGIMTQADAQALFEDNSDFTLNAVTFGVAEVSAQGFAALEAAGLVPAYTYSFCFMDRTLSVAERTDAEKGMLEALSNTNAQVTDLMDASTNQAIGYAANDVDGDSAMWEVLLYIIIAIMAFVFVVLTAGTIEEESAVIGTLLASGYRRRELALHYLALPCVVGVAAAAVGNVCGFTLMEQPMKDLYYNSYSLPPYHMTWSWPVFIKTTLVPVAVLVVITLLGIVRKMGHTPLQFLRHETSRGGVRRGLALPTRLSFIARFRLRVFLRNLGNFATLFVGVTFASLLMLFGLAVMPTITHYADNLRDNMVAAHQYSLKAPLELEGTDEERAGWAAVDALQGVDAALLSRAQDAAEAFQEAQDAAEAQPSLLAIKDAAVALAALYDQVDLVAAELGMTRDDTFELLEDASNVDTDGDDVHPVNTADNGADKIAQAEKYAIYALDYERGGDNGVESVTVYGVSPGSRYWSELAVGEGRAVFGAGMLDKFGLKAGDTVSLYDKYQDTTYTLTVGEGADAAWGSKSDMSVYLALDDFNELLGHDASYFNAYASDEELALDRRYLASDLTPAGMDKIGDQLTNSMGNMMSMLLGLAVFIALVFMYLLTKSVIDRSARAISYMKVFGYRDREISRLYVRSITWCVAVSLVACLPLIIGSLTAIFRSMLLSYSGNIEIYVPASAMVECVALGFAAYAVVAFLHVRHIRRIPLEAALKVQE